MQAHLKSAVSLSGKRLKFKFCHLDEDGGPPADEDDGFLDDLDIPEGKVGAKKLRKLQEKAEKRRQREVSNDHSFHQHF